MRKIKPCLGFPTGLFLVGLAILLYFSATALAQAPQAPTAKPEAAAKPTTPKAVCQTGTCEVRIECPPIKTPGKTVCVATIDCPPPQEKAIEPPKQKPKQQ